MNKKTKITLVFKTLALVLALAVLFPSAVKLSHAFTHHTNQVCNDGNSLNTHFHKYESVCDFYKIKFTSYYYFQNKVITLISIENNHKVSSSQYAFINHYQRLQTALRGPPQWV